jgi:hypothetical protein
MRTLLRATRCVALVPALFPSAGCSDDGCPCEYFTRDELAFDEQFATGSIAWNGDRPLVDDDTPPDGACSARLFLPQRACGPGDDPPEVELEVIVNCTRDGEATGLLIPLGDVRDLPNGRYSREVSTWGAISHLMQDAQVDVVESVGTGDEYPNVVTPDFSKGLRVQFVTGTFDAVLDFELTERHFRADPRKECEACSC